MASPNKRAKKRPAHKSCASYDVLRRTDGWLCCGVFVAKQPSIVYPAYQWRATSLHPAAPALFFPRAPLSPVYVDVNFTVLLVEMPPRVSSNASPHKARSVLMRYSMICRDRYIHSHTRTQRSVETRVLYSMGIYIYIGEVTGTELPSYSRALNFYVVDIYLYAR